MSGSSRLVWNATAWRYGAFSLVLVSGCGAPAEPLPKSLPVDPWTEPAPVSAPVAPRAPKRCIEPTPTRAPVDVPQGPDPRCPADPGHTPLRRGRVHFEAVGAAVDVEIADTEAARDRGLMFRTQLGSDEGMLFVMGRRMVHTFWMENTCIALDLLFVDTDGYVVGIRENVPTMSAADVFVTCPSAFVLEVNAGWARAHGVVAGMMASIER